LIFAENCKFIFGFLRFIGFYSYLCVGKLGIFCGKSSEICTVLEKMETLINFVYLNQIV